MDDKGFMNEALYQAQKSYAEGGIPVGAVLVRNFEHGQGR